ncbi:MAG: SpoIIIAH-like family protein [Oscillospiraceae bacterium]|nr:SpoIIIAH-like family protein [Oscillospiraceae bacterium]
MKLWKRNAVVSCIILFVCIALYLSWAYGRENQEQAMFDPLLTQSPDSAADLSSPAPEVPSAGDYFTETRLARMQARDNALSILGQAAGNTETSQAILDNVAMEIERLSAYAMSEANIETLVRAQGFEDCVAFINQDGITVVVTSPIGGLTSPDVAKIRDIILHETALTAADITLIGKEI